MQMPVISSGAKLFPDVGSLARARSDASQMENRCPVVAHPSRTSLLRGGEIFFLPAVSLQQSVHIGDAAVRHFPPCETEQNPAL